MNGREALRNVGKAVSTFVNGPMVYGTVEAVMRDPEVRTTWHILVKTDQGEERHVICSDREILINREGIFSREMPYYRGDRFARTLRGTGVIIPPGSKISRDPFGLKTEKK